MNTYSFAIELVSIHLGRLELLAVLSSLPEHLERLELLNHLSSLPKYLRYISLGHSGPRFSDQPGKGNVTINAIIEQLESPQYDGIPSVPESIIRMEVECILYDSLMVSSSMKTLNKFNDVFEPAEEIMSEVKEYYRILNKRFNLNLSAGV